LPLPQEGSIEQGPKRGDFGFKALQPDNIFKHLVIEVLDLAARDIHGGARRASVDAASFAGSALLGHLPKSEANAVLTLLSK